MWPKGGGDGSFSVPLGDFGFISRGLALGTLSVPGIPWDRLGMTLPVTPTVTPWCPVLCPGQAQGYTSHAQNLQWPSCDIHLLLSQPHQHLQRCSWGQGQEGTSTEDVAASADTCFLFIPGLWHPHFAL